MIRTLIVILALLLPSLPSQATEGTVLITGANRGIGLALAQQFAEAGYTVIGTARKPAQATELKETGARVMQLDVTDQASVDALAKTLDGMAIDIVINNAGIAGQRSRDVASLDLDSMQRELDVNTFGPLRVIKALLPNAESSKRKQFVNVSSMMGSMELNTWGCCVGYRASKAALNSINKTLAVDLADRGFTFVVVHPGYVQTDMNDNQGNITTDQSATGLYKLISGLDREDNGKFYDWQGEELPW